MERIINVEKMRSLINRTSGEKITDFEISLIEEGVRTILCGGSLKLSMVEYLENIGVINLNSAIDLKNMNLEVQNRIRVKIKSLKLNDYQSEWDYKGLSKNSNFFGTQRDWNQNLLTEILKISAKIHKKVLNGGANFIIVNPATDSVIESFDFFNQNYEEFVGYSFLGKIGGGRFDVISSINIVDENEIVVCRKEVGQTIEDAISQGNFGVIKILGL
jgi:hypothetical protein